MADKTRAVRNGLALDRLAALVDELASRLSAAASRLSAAEDELFDQIQINRKLVLLVQEQQIRLLYTMQRMHVRKVTGSHLEPNPQVTEATLYEFYVDEQAEFRAHLAKTAKELEHATTPGPASGPDGGDEADGQTGGAPDANPLPTKH